MSRDSFEYNHILTSGSRGRIMPPSRNFISPTPTLFTIQKPADTKTSSVDNTIEPAATDFTSPVAVEQDLATNKQPESKSIEIKSVEKPQPKLDAKPLAVIPVYEPFVPAQPTPKSTPKPDIAPLKPKNSLGQTIDESLAQEIGKVELLNDVVKKSSGQHRLSKEVIFNIFKYVVVVIVLGLIGYFGYMNLHIYI